MAGRMTVCPRSSAGHPPAPGSILIRAVADTAMKRAAVVALPESQTVPVPTGSMRE